MIGVRLDSGDRVALSIKARRMLDKAGFGNAKIVCSGDLDEYLMTGLKQRAIVTSYRSVVRAVKPCRGKFTL